MRAWWWMQDHPYAVLTAEVCVLGTSLVIYAAKLGYFQ